ncbi:DgyrCDS11364 [Dimorphilus gyrociliatus]|uniref:DgyrCDS11364 n=1 Tax=Dimorphilus gyrociliatus TaxID=2664684 RepID=A0A7I8W7T1_9ANNE|nr:DgyrCDS11364 [Dimorphilus gyrociliatus]
MTSLRRQDPRLNCFKADYALITRIATNIDSSSSYPYVQQNSKIDVPRAREEQEEFIDVLRRIAIDVIELPCDERHPDGLFIGDCAVVINGTALICNPPSEDGAPPRQGELTVVRQVLKKELGLKIVEVDSEKGKAVVCGTDVLWTGREIFVGIGKRTNILGAQSVAKAFPEYSTSIVNVREPYLHLKDCVSLCGPEILAIAKSNAAKEMLREMRKAGHGYKMIEVEEDLAANTIYCNNTVIHLSSDTIPRSIGLFKDKLDFQCVPVEIKEPLKRGAGLSNIVLLVNKQKHLRSIMTTATSAQ